MRRFSWSLALVLISSFGLLAESVVLSPSQFIQEKKSSHQVLAKIQLGIQTEKWKEVCTLVKTALNKESVSFHQLETLAKSYPGTAFASAIKATKSILGLKEKTGLSCRVVLPIALFAESYLKDEVMKGHLYFPKSEFGRVCEYDPDLNHLIIHLDGVKQLGAGRMKVVFRALLYDKKNPEIVAHAVTNHNVKNEMYAMKSLLGVEGVIQADALLSHTDHHSKKTTNGIVTPIYNQGSLFSVLQKSGSTLSFGERLKIAQCLITGLASMHENGFVHRDLGVKNHFIHFEQNGHHDRKITAVIADLGRALPISKAKNTSVQGNSFYYAPEGFFPSKLKGKDYCASDVFALGCVFWQLYFDKLPAWSAPRYAKREDWSVGKRYHAHLNLLKKTREPYVHYLHEKKSRKTCLNVHDKFLEIILKMTNPAPKARGTAVSLKKELLRIK